MTPRHPPRALGGLTTPTRPPPPTREPEGLESPARWTGTTPESNLPSVPRPAASCDATGHSFLRLRVDAPPPSTGGPTSPRAFVERLIICHYHADSRIRDACVTDDRIVKDAIGADDGSRPESPPAGPFPAPTWPLTRGRGSLLGCTAPHSAGRAQGLIRTETDPSPAPGVPGRTTSETVAGEASL